MTVNYVVEPECEGCGAPLGRGVIAVRPAGEGDSLGERGVRDDEIPDCFVEAAASAHPRLAIKKWDRCSFCWEP